MADEPTPAAITSWTRSGSRPQALPKWWASAAARVCTATSRLATNLIREPLPKATEVESLFANQVEDRRGLLVSILIAAGVHDQRRIGGLEPRSANWSIQEIDVDWKTTRRGPLPCRIATTFPSQRQPYQARHYRQTRRRLAPEASDDGRENSATGVRRATSATDGAT